MGGEIHADPGGIYGSPRVHAVLKREGVHLRRKRVAWETFAHADADLVLSTVEYALAENPWMITRTECIRGRVLGTRTGANLAPFELGLLLAPPEDFLVLGRRARGRARSGHDPRDTT
ncbi:hypothetical protein OG613_02930 [Streptomyces sp. NBC_00015]|uniref:hypothetical protein n=1 Tax=unclassified Streptomyces TaxID=2593676 RepID=UPI0032517231